MTIDKIIEYIQNQEYEKASKYYDNRKDLTTDEIRYYINILVKQSSFSVSFLNKMANDLICSETEKSDFIVISPESEDIEDIEDIEDGEEVLDFSRLQDMVAKSDYGGLIEGIYRGFKDGNKERVHDFIVKCVNKFRTLISDEQYDTLLNHAIDYGYLPIVTFLVEYEDFSEFDERTINETKNKEIQEYLAGWNKLQVQHKFAKLCSEYMEFVQKNKNNLPELTLDKETLTKQAFIKNLQDKNIEAIIELYQNF